MKLDRLLGIITVLLRNDSDRDNRITAPYLADKFEVSRRTIGRDIDTLCQAGIPIITHQGGGGGIEITEGYKLDKSILTADELFDIIAALKGIGSVSEQSKIERTFEKLHPNINTVVSMREPVVIDLSSHYKNQLTDKIEQIKRAVLEQRFIEFDYYYEKGDSHRRIEPYCVIFKWTSWYVFGFCHERQDWRMFKLTRLWGLTLCDEIYTLREIPPERQDFDMQFSDNINLVALFEPSAKYQLIETYGIDCYTETKDGLRLEIGFTNHSYMISWLLGFGNKVKVIEPSEIADELREIAEKMLANYKYR